MIDEWKCLGCKCTFEGGCRLEEEMAAASAAPRTAEPEPIRRLPPIRKKQDATYHRETRRRRLERAGFTVRESKSR